MIFPALFYDSYAKVQKQFYICKKIRILSEKYLYFFYTICACV